MSLKMEEHFLKDFVAGQSGFSPEPWYNPHGDCIIYQTSDEAIVAERVDDVLTIYRSAITGKSIGCQIKGVKAIMHLFGLGAVALRCKQSGQEITEISLFMFLLAAYEKGPPTIRRRTAYADAFSSSGRDSPVRITDLEPA
jgi:hypothetical protein